MMNLMHIVPLPARIGVVAALVVAVWGHGYIQGKSAEQAKQIEAQLTQYEFSADVMTWHRTRLSQLNDDTLRREALLLSEIDALTTARDSLDDELENRPQVYIDREVSTPAECPVSYRIDWDCFACLHNYAKGTGPDCVRQCAGITGWQPANLPWSNRGPH